jgi:ferredoxin
MSRPLTIVVDHALCVGNGQCVHLAPGVFRHNAAVQSVVHDSDGAAEAVVLKAARYCPTGAIRVEDRSTGHVLFPQQIE